MFVVGCVNVRALVVLFFAPFQEIRHVLGSAGGSGADGGPADDPVTSLDMFVGSDYLVAGHGSGQVFLWDYLRYTSRMFEGVLGGEVGVRRYVYVVLTEAIQTAVQEHPDLWGGMYNGGSTGVIYVNLQLGSRVLGFACPSESRSVDV